MRRTANRRTRTTVTAMLFFLFLLVFSAMQVRAEIRFDRASVNVMKKGSRKLRISCSGKYTVTTTDKSVATVTHSGKVKGKKAGNCRIVVTCGAETASIPVHVLSSLRSGNILFMGHRGYQDKYPENTISSFRGAMDYGAAGAEFDVRYADSGEFFVFHDLSLSRVCNHGGSIRNLTEKNRASHRARKGKKSDLIPTLEEALRYLGSRGGIAFVHLKEGEAYVGHRGDSVAQLIRQTGMTGQSVVFCGNLPTLEYFAVHYPDIQTGFFIDSPSESYTESAMKKAAAFGASWIFLFRARQISYGMVQNAHQLGLKIGLYKTLKKKEVLDLLDYGADFSMLYHKLI